MSKDSEEAKAYQKGIDEAREVYNETLGVLPTEMSAKADADYLEARSAKRKEFVTEHYPEETLALSIKLSEDFRLRLETYASHAINDKNFSSSKTCEILDSVVHLVLQQLTGEIEVVKTFLNSHDKK